MMEQETLSLKALPSAEQATQSTVPAPAAERERTAGASAEDRIRELTEENELLFEQLHVVQEELEKYYHRLKECEQRTAAPTAGSGVCSAKALDAFMENWKLRALVQQQKIALQVVCRNSLPARLGKILITGVGSTSSFLSLPLKLRRMWKAIDRTVPPPELGGKDFSEAIKAYAVGGADAVEKLLDSVFLSPGMRANAYTVLARHLLLTDVRKAAEYARLAWETDPRPYRFKWLAFRLHDADDAITAEALLDMLPDDMTMTESEQRQAARIRHESQQLRKRAAEKEAGGAKQEAVASGELARLREERDAHRRQADDLRAQLRKQQQESSDLQVRLTASEEEAADAREALQSAEAERDALRQEADYLREQLDEQQQERSDLQARLAASEEEAAGIREALQRAEVQRDAQRREAESLRAQLGAQESILVQRAEELSRTNARYDDLQKLYAEEIRFVTAQQKDMYAVVMEQEKQLHTNLSAQLDALKSTKSALQSAFKREIDNALQQSVAYTGLHDYFASGRLPVVTPWQRGWPASPDFMCWLVELIEQNDYDLIVEFGSGMTTVYTARTLAARIRRDASQKVARAVSFEHQEEFCRKTRELLSQGGCNEILESVEVVHAPLHPYTAPDGTVYQYYACEEQLSALSAAYKSSASRILVTVDGPPRATGKNARYPAFPLVMRYLASAHIDFLLDDYNRDDERELAGAWQSACDTAGLRISVTERACEKGAFLLSVHSL